ncbi:MAG: hypothetical protein ABFR75_06125 [Acidobacteriota bacterium]
MKERGSLLFSVSFILLISFLGLTLLTFSITHTKIVSARGKKNRETGKLYNQLYLLLHESKKKICSSDLSSIENPLDNFFNNEIFPIINNKNFKLTRKFSFNSIQKEGYKVHRGYLDISAISKRSGYKYASQNIFNLLSGNIPVSLIPLLINRGNNEADRPSASRTFTYGSSLSPPPGENKVSINTSGYLAQIFGIESGILCWKNIRKELGLLEYEKELPEGIYLFLKESQIISILIQGDVKSIHFSIDSDKQKIQIDSGKELFRIEYIPKENYFLLEDSNYDTSLNFNENLVINGNVGSISQTGEYAFTENTSIELIVLGSLNINSSLLQAGKNNTIVNKKAPVQIRALRSPFLEFPRDPVIRIRAGDNSKIDGSIMAQGEIINYSKDLLVKGTVYTEKLSDNGKMKISPVYGNGSDGKYFHMINYNYIQDFRINYIEEVFYE